MATYKEIYGSTIEVVTSDPPNPVEGQIWYNSTDNVVKGFALTTAGAWATGGSTNTGRFVPGGGGTKDAGIIFGGQPGGGTSIGNTELYNGTAWTEVNDLNTARERISPAANTQTAALGSGGVIYPGASDQALTESWNGTCWSEVADLNTGDNGQFGFGDNTAAINAGGGSPPSQNKTEIWNGTSWTTSPATLNQGRKDNEGGGMGTSTAGLIAGGNNGSPAYGNTESWNGTSWTEVNDLNTARTALVLSGTQDLGLAFGGQPPQTTATEEWNGTSWTTTTAMNIARRNFGGSMGTGTTSAFAATGIDPSFPPTVTTSTEEWTGAGTPVTYTFTDS